jgi:hypothetical protein
MADTKIEIKSVERYSGHDEDFDTWHLRFQGDADTLGYLNMYDGTEAAPTPADPSAPTAAETTTINTYKAKSKRAYWFLLKALDETTALNIRTAVQHPDAKQAYDELLRLKANKGEVSVMRLLNCLLNARTTSGTDPMPAINLQAQINLKLSAASIAMPPEKKIK